MSRLISLIYARKGVLSGHSWSPNIPPETPGWVRSNLHVFTVHTHGRVAAKWSRGRELPNHFNLHGFQCTFFLLRLQHFSERAHTHTNTLHGSGCPRREPGRPWSTRRAEASTSLPCGEHGGPGAARINSPCGALKVQCFPRGGKRFISKTPDSHFSKGKIIQMNINAELINIYISVKNCARR